MRRRGQSLGKDYRRVWSAAAISSFGDGIVDFGALPLLALYLTSSPLLIAGVYAMVRLPGLLLSLPAGVVADRADRRWVMIVADVIRAAVLLLIAALLSGGHMTIMLLYVCAFALGAARVFFDIASLSILPALVPDDQLERGSARLIGATMSTADLAGLPLSGALYAFSRPLPFLADALSFVSSALILRTIKSDLRIRNRVGRTQLLPEIREGLHEFFRSRDLVRLALVSSGVGAGNAALISLLVLYTKHDLGLGARGYGLVLGLSAVGGLLGSLSGERVSGRLGAGPALACALIVAGGADLALALLPSLAVAIVALAASGYAIVLWNMVALTTRLRLIPPELLGRVTSVWRLWIWGVLPLGSVLGGLAASASSVRTTYFGAGLLLLALTPFPLRWGGRQPSASEVAELALVEEAPQLDPSAG